MRIDDWSSDLCSSDLIQSLPVDHQVAVVLDDVGRLEITDIAGVIHRVDQEPAAGLERFRGDREHPPAVRVIVEVAEDVSPVEHAVEAASQGHVKHVAVDVLDGDSKDGGIPPAALAKGGHRVEGKSCVWGRKVRV